MSAQLGDACSSALHDVMDYLDSKVQDPKAFPQIQESYRMKAINDPVSFLYVLADIIAYTVQYDNPNQQQFSFRHQLCETGIKHAPSPEAKMALHVNFTRYFLDTLRIDPVSMDVTSFKDPNVKDDDMMRQWMYQSCTEFGYFQTAPKLNPLRSRLITTEWHIEAICQGIFKLPKNQPNVDETNTIYGARDVCIDRIAFTHGEHDPWKMLGVKKVPVKSSHDRLVRQTSQSPNFDFHSSSHCSDKKMPVYVIKGVGHCADLHASNDRDNDDLVRTRKQVAADIRAWLAED
jgi:serine protease 16